jgi:GTPase SAR1 family protein
MFIKKIDLGKKVISAELWDTAGQEKYMSLSLGFIRNANA